MAKTDSVAEPTAPTRLEEVRPDIAQAIDAFVEDHLPPELWQQQATRRDRDALKTQILSLIS